MKKTLILAIAAALVLGGVSALMADEQKAAGQTVSAPSTAQTAEAAKPVPTTLGSEVAAGTTTPAPSKQEVSFKCSGLNKDTANVLKTDLVKANGVFTANVDPTTGKVICQIDPSKTNADKLVSWVKTNKPDYSCSK